MSKSKAFHSQLFEMSSLLMTPMEEENNNDTERENTTLQGVHAAKKKKTRLQSIKKTIEKEGIQTN